MKQQRLHHVDKDHVTIKLSDEQIIVCRFHGHITEAIIKEYLTEVRQCVATLHMQNRPALLLQDISHVSDQVTGAHKLARSSDALGVDKAAIISNTTLIGLQIQYFLGAVATLNYVRVFQSTARAKTWLLARPGQHNDAKLRNISALLVVVMGLLTLFGWAFNVTILAEIIPGLKAMNPVTALTLILLAFVLVLIRTGQLKPWPKGLILAIASWSCLLGTLVLLRTLFGVNVHIDDWLFTKELALSQYGGFIAPRGGLNFLLIGGMILMVLTGQRQARQRHAFHIASAIVFLNTFSSIVSSAFGLTLGHTFDWYTLIPLNAALCFLLINRALQGVTAPEKFFAKAWQIYRRYGQSVVVFIVIMIAVGFIWQQSRFDLQRNVQTTLKNEYTAKQQLINDRVTTYINVLRGYRSFFEASSMVVPSEFHTYFESSELQKHYPGFSSIVFVRSIPKTKKPEFTAEMRAQATSDYPQYRTFDIHPITNTPVSYPTIFVEPHSATTTYGLDLAFNDTRRIALEQARDSGNPGATGILDLNATAAGSRPRRPGFFLTIPLYNRGVPLSTLPTVQVRQSQIYGFINAYFEDKVLFGDLFKDERRTNIRYTISSADNGEVLYTYNPKSSGIQPKPQVTGTIPFAGQSWRLALYTTSDFGSSGLEHLLPAIVIVAGTMLAGLMALLVLIQSHKREQALRLVMNMTKDLNDERKRMATAEAKSKAMLLGIGEGLVATDTDAKIILVNPAFETLLGWKEEEVLGKGLLDILPLLDENNVKLSAAERPLPKALKGLNKVKTIATPTLFYKGKSGQLLPVRIIVSPIVLDGKVIGAVEVFRDVTTEREIDKAKTEFVSLASHQLRTPLSTIGWYAEMLISGDAGKISPEQAEYVNEIYEGNQRMVELVNALLNVSRLDLGTFIVEPEPTNVVGLAQAIVRGLEPRIFQRKIDFREVYAEHIPIMNIDPKLTQMIIENLASNAIKYTPEKGKVTLALKLQGKNLLISVADTGYGIPTSQQDRIFSKLFRADNVRMLDTEGTGLGLYIVKSIVDYAGGKIWFDSTEGHGSTFYVRLPPTGMKAHEGTRALDDKKH